METPLGLRTHGDFQMTTYKPSRLFLNEAQLSFNPEIENTPPLPIIDWSAVGQVAPKLLTSSGLQRSRWTTRSSLKRALP